MPKLPKRVYLKDLFYMHDRRNEIYRQGKENTCYEIVVLTKRVVVSFFLLLSLLFVLFPSRTVDC